MWEGVGDRTELQHIDPNSIGHNRVSFPFSWAAQLGTWGPSLSGTCSSIQHLLTNWSDLQTLNRGSRGPFCRLLASSTTSLLPIGLVSKLTDIRSSLSYIIIQRPFFLWASQLHSFNPSTAKVIILLFLDRMHLLFTLVHFLIWQPGRVVGQYTTKG